MIADTAHFTISATPLTNEANEINFERFKRQISAKSEHHVPDPLAGGFPIQLSALCINIFP